MQKCLIVFLVFLLVPVCVAAQDYVIGDGDTLQISVWGESTVSTSATVRPDGKITLPGIGDVVATGFTPMELSQKLSEKLREFVKKPIVTVAVTGITNNKIYVFGGGILGYTGGTGGKGKEGEAPDTQKTSQSALTSGVYNLPGRTTLLKFLTGLGVVRTADLEGAYIIRGGKKLEVDFYALFMEADLSKDIYLQAGDMIFVPDNTHNKIYVMGAVNSPKYVYYWRGVSILDVILEAGGFTKFARENSVVVLRKEGTSEKRKELVLKVKDLMKDGDITQNIPMMPGDFVIVKEGIL